MHAGQSAWINFGKEKGKVKLASKVYLLIISLVVSILSAKVSFAETDKSLVGYWKFDEGEGEIAEDSSANKNNGLIFNASWVKGKVGHALELSGKNSSVELGPEKFDDLVEGTIEIWFKCASVEKPARVLFSHNCGSNYCNIFLGPNRHLIFDMVVDGQVQLYSDKPISLDNWHHVVTTFGAEGMRMYVNGVLQKKTGPTTKSFKEMGSSKTNTIGTIGKSTAYNFHGIIDEIKIYDRVLTEREIKNRYAYEGMV